MKTKQAFTLAEVLLTLAVIGIVAALTIPAVITKVAKDQYVVGLKKAYNTLKAVEREAIQEHGEMANWDWTLDAEQFFSKYFKPCFDIIKDCGMEDDSECLASSYKYLSGTSVDNRNISRYYKIITSDGMAYAYWGGEIFVDVNGPKKEPNQTGRDFFLFNVQPNTNIKPWGTYDGSGSAMSTDDMINHPVYGCTTDPAGTRRSWYCTGRVLAEGAMNY